MSLIPFHKFLIGTAILFCAGFAVWQVAAFLRTGAGPALLLAAGFLAAAAGLGYYLRHLPRFLGLRDRCD
jgi:hypothetical protein